MQSSHRFHLYLIPKFPPIINNLHSVQFSSVAQSCATLCNSMNCSTPGLPVHHHLLAFTQTHAHWVSDTIQPSHPLSSPSPAPNPSQHQSLPKLMSMESVMPSNHLILCRPLLLLSLIFPSIRVFFQWVSSAHQVANVLEFQLQHQSYQWTPRTDLL